MEPGRFGRISSVALLYHWFCLCFCWDPLDPGATSGNHLVSSQEQLRWPIQCTLWPLWWCLASVIYQALLCRLASSWLLLIVVGGVLAFGLLSAGCNILCQKVFLSLKIHLHTPSAGNSFMMGSWYILLLMVMLLSVDCWMTGLTVSVAGFTWFL